MADIQPLTDRAFRYIRVIRSEKVLMDQDLAVFYGVETKVLLQTVKRNRARFPSDFMFQITAEEFDDLRCQIDASNGKKVSRSQITTLNTHGRGGRRYLPYVFTEQGVAMLSGVLRSQRAIQVNIAIMRAFVRLRDVLSTHRDLAAKLTELETQLDRHDREIMALFDALRELVEPPDDPPKPPIGFQTEAEGRKQPAKQGARGVRCR